LWWTGEWLLQRAKSCPGRDESARPTSIRPAGAPLRECDVLVERHPREGQWCSSPFTARVQRSDGARSCTRRRARRCEAAGAGAVSSHPCAPRLLDSRGARTASFWMVRDFFFGGPQPFLARCRAARTVLAPAAGTTSGAGRDPAVDLERALAHHAARPAAAATGRYQSRTWPAHGFGGALDGKEVGARNERREDGEIAAGSPRRSRPATNPRKSSAPRVGSGVMKAMIRPCERRGARSEGDPAAPEERSAPAARRSGERRFVGIG